MKKHRIKLLLIFFTIILVTCAYINSSFYIRNQTWKYNDGTHIGDILKLDNRTIYRNGEVIAKVFLCYGKTLIIKDVNTGEKGYYSRKEF